jgi:uncharacterized protein (TIGR03437 family)
VSAATFAPGEPVAPGSLVAIFGSNLASTTGASDSIPLSTQVANVSVTFNGVPTPLIAVFPGGNSSQINAQLPWNVLPQGSTSGAVSLVVTTNGVSSSSAPVQVDRFEPGIFSLNQQGNGYGAITSADGTAFIAPTGAIPGVNSRPARIGDVIVIYATGLGAVDAPPNNGDIPRQTALVKTTTTPTVLIGGAGGVAGQVQFSGLNPYYVGLYQINVQIMPGTPTGNAVPIQIQMGNVISTDKMTIAVSQ